MKIAIVGSREIKRCNVGLLVKESGFIITEEISGKAPGMDTLGELWALGKAIPVKPFPARWDDIEPEPKYPTKKLKRRQNGSFFWVEAGFARNQEIVDYAEGIIAVRLDGFANNGTNDTIQRASKAGLSIVIFTLNSDFEPFLVQGDLFS